MKKWILAIGVLLLISLACIYLLIPSVIRISEGSPIEGPSKALVRYELEQVAWKRWWPGSTLSTGKAAGIDASFLHGQFRYTIRDKKYSAIVIGIAGNDSAGGPMGGDSVTSSMDFVTDDLYSSHVVWAAAITTSLNPVSRVRAWFRARALKKDMTTLLTTLRNFYHEDRNIYGLDIKIDALKDTLLMSTFRVVANYPSQSLIDSLFNGLRDYVRRSGAKETGKPMLNIGTEAIRDSILVRVALPVDKRLPSSGNISVKLMPPMVKMYVTDVTGGPHTADQAMQTVDFFAVDHSYSLPAIPFFSLITDRSGGVDSSKWITRIFYPIM